MYIHCCYELLGVTSYTGHCSSQIQYKHIMHITNVNLINTLLVEKQIQLMEESAETLRDRSLKFNKGCRKYM